MEALEDRTLFSLVTSWETLGALSETLGPIVDEISGRAASYPTGGGHSLDLKGGPGNYARPRGPDGVEDFRLVNNSLIASVIYRFASTPEVRDASGLGYIALADEALWVQPGEPVLPVRSARLLLPAGTESVHVRVIPQSGGVPIEFSHPAIATPTASIVGQTLGAATPLEAVPVDKLANLAPVQYRIHRFRGFQIVTLAFFPVLWDAERSQLMFYDAVTVEVTAVPTSTDKLQARTAADRTGAGAPFATPLPVRLLPGDLSTITALVDNPSAVTTYIAGSVGDSSFRLPWMGHVDYVIVTSEELSSAFGSLVQHRQNQGLSAAIVTTSYITAYYSGFESGDLADKIRQFISDAYVHWGTSWVLLGGDVEIIPARGVVGRVGSVFEPRLTSDLYYACLDGPWDGNGNGLWGEPVDGFRGTDVDLVPDVFVGRAPVSNSTEVANFINKLIRYETTVHPNRTAALWLGETLDERTDGGISGELIRQLLPSDWQVIERYDRDRVWTTSEVVTLLNNSPHLVNHLGHAGERYNARLTVSQVLGLSNRASYILYSQGCYSGAFDLCDLAIGEAHVVASAGAVATVMNTRYGWYVPGPVPGGNHFYALEFWDAFFNEELTHLGAAYVDSILDNLFRVQEAGVYRWIHFGTVLLGDPATLVQVATPGPPSRDQVIWGRVSADSDRNGQASAGNTGLPSVLVYLDTNTNGSYDRGTVNVDGPPAPAHIPDYGTLRSAVGVETPGAVTGLSVWISLEHQYIHDLEIFLVAPTGTRVKLLSRPPIGAGKLDRVIFTDAASNPIPPNEGIITGTFRPAEPLRSLEGIPAQGLWTIEIVDTMPQDAGRLLGWGMTLTYGEPSTLTQADGTFSFSQGFAGQAMLRIEPPSGWHIMSPLEESYPITPGQVSAQSPFLFLLAPLPQQVPALGKLDWREWVTIARLGKGSWFSFRPSRPGICTVEVTPVALGDQGLRVDIYDPTGRRLASDYQSGGKLRVDFLADPAQQYLVSLKGADQPVQARLVNLIEFSGPRALVHGTNMADNFAVKIGEEIQVMVADLVYEIPPGLVEAIHILAGAGRDQLVVDLSGSPSTVLLRNGELTVNHRNIRLAADRVEIITVVAATSGSLARLFGTTGADRFVWTHRGTVFVTAGTTLELGGFSRVEVWGGGGMDVAKLYDTPGKDRLFIQPERATLYTSSATVVAHGFPNLYAFSTQGGGDSVYFLAGPGPDRFFFTPAYAMMSGAGYSLQAEGFRWVQARASSSEDVAQIYGSSGKDSLLVTPQYVLLTGANFSVRVERFGQVVVTTTAGSGSLSRFFDSPGDDYFRVGLDYVEMIGPTSRVVAKNFDLVRIYSQAGGQDKALVHQVPQGAQLRLTPGWVHVANQRVDIQLSGVEQVAVRTEPSVGALATVYDSSAQDLLEVAGRGFSLESERYRLVVEGVARVRAVGRYGARLQFAQTALDYVLETTGLWRLV
ncbi:MAG: C25 family cysteine peptidase [Thermoguttaceae bacterium]|nr:C25 family cysteine peptidase [Thermoguttaceae bacterium]